MTRRDFPIYRVYQDAAGEWRWRLVAANGRIIADSSEGYTRCSDAERAIAAVRVAAVTPAIEVTR